MRNKINLLVLCFGFIGSSVMAINGEEQGKKDSVKVDRAIEEVVVTGTKTKQLLGNVPIETSIVTRKEILDEGIVSVGDAVRRLTGINMSGGAPFGSARRETVVMRGMPAHYSLILVDGKRIKGEHIHTGVNLSVVPVEFIERIEVVKGPISALYGSDAMGGVINIITRPVPEDGTGHAGVSYGSFGTQNYDVAYGKKFGKFGCFFSGKYTDSEGYPMEGYDDQWFKQGNVLGKISYDFNKNNALILNAKYYDTEYLRKTSKDVRDKMLDLNLEYKSTLSEKSTLKVSAAYSGFEGSRKEAKNRTSGVDVFYSYSISENNLLSVGMEGRHEYFTRVAVQPAKEENIFSAYAQEDVKLGQKVHVIASLRMDKHSDLSPVLSPNASVLYRPYDSGKIRASIGRGFRAPTLQDRYEYRFWHKPYYRDGNPDLEPEYSISYNLGFEQVFNNSFHGRVSLFRNDFENMIMVLPTGEVESDGNEIHRRENVKEALTQGVEAEMNYNLRNVEFVVGYTFLDTEDDEGNVLSYNPKHQFVGRVKHNFKKIKLISVLSVEQSMDRYYNEKGTLNKLEDYTLLNLNITKSFGKYAQVYGTIGNILDQEFKTYEEGATFIGFGRTFNVGAKFFW